MEKQMEKKEECKQVQKTDEHPEILKMKAVTKGAYGGGMYGTEAGQPEVMFKPPASDIQNADGPVETTLEPKHKPPPSSGDRDIDITGQSYIQ